jgi:hypothetical protein
LVLAAGVLIGRDQLFAAETTAGPSSTIPMSAAPSDIDRASLTETGPRIVEVPLPMSLDSGPAQERGYELERDSDDDWDDEDDRDDDRGDDERHDDDEDEDEDDDN